MPTMGWLPQGVPPAFRPWAWYEVSGAAAKRKRYGADYFDRMANLGLAMPAVHQIELVSVQSASVVVFACVVWLQCLVVVLASIVVLACASGCAEYVERVAIMGLAVHAVHQNELVSTQVHCCVCSAWVRIVTNGTSVLG